MRDVCNFYEQNWGEAEETTTFLGTNGAMCAYTNSWKLKLKIFSNWNSVIDSVNNKEYWLLCDTWSGGCAQGSFANLPQYAGCCETVVEFYFNMHTHLKNKH